MSTLNGLPAHVLLAGRAADPVTPGARTCVAVPAAGPTDLEQHELARVLARLTAAFPAVHPDDVAEQVRRADHRFDGCRVRTYVPLFVERSARAALRLPAAP